MTMQGQIGTCTTMGASFVPTKRLLNAKIAAQSSTDSCSKRPGWRWLAPPVSVAGGDHAGLHGRLPIADDMRTAGRGAVTDLTRLGQVHQRQHGHSADRLLKPTPHGLRSGQRRRLTNTAAKTRMLTR